jgi:PIN domain nuclease of toxin-antitoxin system
VISLDTHALVWWVSDPKRLGAKARRALDAAVAAGDAVAVSSICMWEVAMLVEHGRLALTMDTDLWINHVESLPFVNFIPVDARVALRAVTLNEFPHRDPADRMIVATAIGLNATLVTADTRIRSYPAVKCIWD